MAVFDRFQIARSRERDKSQYRIQVAPCFSWLLSSKSESPAWIIIVSVWHEAFDIWME